MKKIQKAVNADTAEVTAKTVCNAHGLLSSALGMFYHDFVLRTTLPKKQKRLKRDLPTPQQVYKAVKGSDIETPVLFAMWLGLRMSELRGIRTNEDIVGNTLYIRHVIVTVDRKPVEKNLTKTEISTRIYKLPDELLSKVDFSKPHITELTDSTLYSRFVAAIEKAGLPHMTFHDLRHQYVKYTTKKLWVFQKKFSEMPIAFCVIPRKVRTSRTLSPNAAIATKISFL